MNKTFCVRQSRCWCRNHGGSGQRQRKSFGSGNRHRTLDGAWQLSVTPYNCVTGQESTLNTVRADMTIASGGTLVETTRTRISSLANAVGLGFWERRGARLTTRTFRRSSSSTASILRRHQRAHIVAVRRASITPSRCRTPITGPAAIVTVTDLSGATGWLGCQSGCPSAPRPPPTPTAADRSPIHCCKPLRYFSGVRLRSREPPTSAASPIATGAAGSSARSRRRTRTPPAPAPATARST